MAIAQKSKKTYRQKNKKYQKTNKNQMYKKKLIKLNKTLPNVYYFNRSVAYSFTWAEIRDTPGSYFGPGFRLHVSSDPADPQSALCQYNFTLSQFPDALTDFGNLFKYYKINAVSMKQYSTCGIGGGNTRENTQLMMYTLPGGPPETHSSANFNESSILQSQVCKKRVLLSSDPEPINYYMKLRQCDVQRNETNLNSRQVMTTPKWIPFNRQGITQNDVPHYGIIQRVQMVNNSALPDNIGMKVIIKAYISCKQVR